MLFSEFNLIVNNISYQNPYDFTTIHRHDYFEFMLFDHGGDGGIQTIDFEEYNIESKTLYIVVPNQVHLMRRKPSEDGILIQFTKEFLAQAISPFQVDWVYQLSASPKTLLSNDQYDNIKLLLDQLKEKIRKDNQFKNQTIKSLFSFIFFEILNMIPSKIDTNPKPANSIEFLLLVEEKFRDIKSVKGYSDLMGIPINRLTLEVKKQFGKSPLHIIHDAILIEVKRLLIIERLTHKEIAYQLKFDSQSSYSRFIKQKTGLTPSQLKDHIFQTTL